MYVSEGEAFIHASSRALWTSMGKTTSGAKIDFGLGKRMLGAGGYYYPKYNLSIQLNLDEYEGHACNS